MSSEEEIQQEVDALLVRPYKAMESEVRDLVSRVVKRANTERAAQYATGAVTDL